MMCHPRSSQCLEPFLSSSLQRRSRRVGFQRLLRTSHSALSYFHRTLPWPTRRTQTSTESQRDDQEHRLGSLRTPSLCPRTLSRRPAPRHPWCLHGAWSSFFSRWHLETSSLGWLLLEP